MELYQAGLNRMSIDVRGIQVNMKMLPNSIGLLVVRLTLVPGAFSSSLICA